MVHVCLDENKICYFFSVIAFHARGHVCYVSVCLINSVIVRPVVATKDTREREDQNLLIRNAK